MVASEKNINFIIDDGLLIKDNEVIAGESAKKAETKVATVRHALFYEEKEISLPGGRIQRSVRRDFALSSSHRQVRIRY